MPATTAGIKAVLLSRTVDAYPSELDFAALLLLRRQCAEIWLFWYLLVIYRHAHGLLQRR